jgi:hypothetical protein
MSVGAHGRQTPNKGLHRPDAWVFADATDRQNFAPSEGAPMLEAQLTADDLGRWGLQEDTGVYYRLTAIGPVTWEAIGAGLGPHSSTHEDGGGDEIDVTGLSGLLADPQTPDSHASTHENGGSDELDVTGLEGVLAEPQTPASHASTHQDGGSDEIAVESLPTGSTDLSTRLRPDGGGGVEWVDEADITGSSTGSSTTSGTTFLTKTSIVLPAEDETFIVEAHALVSHSNTTGNPGVRVRNQTDAATLGRTWQSEMADSDNVISTAFRREVVQTVVGGAKTIALEYALISGSGTMTISDAYLTARRKVS